MRADTITPSITGSYSLEPGHSRLGFVACSAVATMVRGAFTELVGRIYFDVDDPAMSHLRITIASTSIDTGDADRDAWLRSEESLDVANYPSIGFVSTSVDRVDSNVFRIVGDLTIKGVTRPVTVDFELMYSGAAVDPSKYQRVGFEGRAVINPMDWRLTGPETLESAPALVAPLVTLELDMSAIKRL